MTGTKRVLIVDDRKLGRDTVRGSLRRLGCECTEAATGAAALALIAEHFFDVIFLDLGLTDIPGLDIVRQARSRAWPLGKVIVYTGLPDPESKAEAESLGVFRYLIKQSAGLEDIRGAFKAAVAVSGEPLLAEREL